MPRHFQRGRRLSEHLFSFGHRAPPTYTMAAPLHPLPTHGRAPPKSPPMADHFLPHPPRPPPEIRPIPATLGRPHEHPHFPSGDLRANLPATRRCSTPPECFPNPKEMVNDLHSIGFKAIWMLDPGIKKEEGYFVYDSGSSNDLWIQNADGEPFSGEVWPGPCVFPDFTREQTRSWWGKLVRDCISNGVDGIWNDMNEPAVFKTVTKTMPGSNIHQGDPELGGARNHSHYHNVYGMLMARSTYEGMKMASETKRPFVLTRVGFIGSQRYAATWTGDNLSNWEHLHMSLPMLLQLIIAPLKKHPLPAKTPVAEGSDSEESSDELLRKLRPLHQPLKRQLILVMIPLRANLMMKIKELKRRLDLEVNCRLQQKMGPLLPRRLRNHLKNPLRVTLKKVILRMKGPPWNLFVTLW